MKSEHDRQMLLDLYLHERMCQTDISKKRIFIEVETPALAWVGQMRENKEKARDRRDGRVFYDPHLGTIGV